MIFNIYYNHHTQHNSSKNISKIYHEIDNRSSPYILHSIFISSKLLPRVDRLGMNFITPSSKDVSTIHTVACIIFTSWVIIAIGYPHLTCISAFFTNIKRIRVWAGASFGVGFHLLVHCNIVNLPIVSNLAVSVL
jgi:hypothetical protein